MSTMALSKTSSMNWGRNSISKKLLLTAGVIPHSVGKCPEGTKGTGSKAVQMSQNLEGLGFTMVQFGQGYKDMSPPTKELMKLTLEQTLAHSGHPVLRWMMDNIFIRRDPAGNIKPDKEKSTEKIDGAVAMIMALDRAIRCGCTGDGTSVYDERDMLIL